MCKFRIGVLFRQSEDVCPTDAHQLFPINALQWHLGVPFKNVARGACATATRTLGTIVHVELVHSMRRWKSVSEKGQCKGLALIGDTTKLADDGGTAPGHLAAARLHPLDRVAFMKECIHSGLECGARKRQGDVHAGEILAFDGWVGVEKVNTAAHCNHRGELHKKNLKQRPLLIVPA